MNRPLPAANGSSKKLQISLSTVSSSPCLASVATSSPVAKFPLIKKSRNSPLTKFVRPRLEGKGVSLPKVSSITFAGDTTAQDLDAGEEVEVLKCILVREGYLQRLGQASSANRISGAYLAETIDVLDLLRLVTLETVEAIVSWRKAKQKTKANDKARATTVSEPQEFKWNGINYLLKLASDLDLLRKHTELVEWLGFSLERNPFILPWNLESRAKLLSEQHSNAQLVDTVTSQDLARYMPVGGNRLSDAKVSSQALAERRRVKTSYETRVVNDEELVPSKFGRLASPSKRRTSIGTGKTNYCAVLPFQIGEVDLQRLHEAEAVVLDEEATFGRYARDIHGRVVPEDEAQRRFRMVELSDNVYNIPATLTSSYPAQEGEDDVLRPPNVVQSDVPGKLHAKKRSGMLGPISKPQWRSFACLPPPRQRARGAQFEEALLAERKANARFGAVLDSLKEEMERKAMDVAYFESCSERQVFGQELELEALTSQAQRELAVLRREHQEKQHVYKTKLVNIQKKEEMLNTFKTQHKAVEDARHAKRIETSRGEQHKATSLFLDQDRRQDEEQAALRSAATELHQHEQAIPFVQHFCATQVQKLVRGMLARAIYEQRKIEFVVASTFIQAGVRGFLARRRVAKMYWHHTASVRLQRIARGYLARRLAKDKRTRRLKERSAERIQKVVRGRFGRLRMAQLRTLVSWRMQLALAAQAVDAAALLELARACQAMVALPNVINAASLDGKRLPALVLGLVRLLMLFTSDADDEWDIPTIRWRDAAQFLHCSVSVARRMHKIADAAAGATRALTSRSGAFAAAGAATSVPYLRESLLGTALLKAYSADRNFRVKTFERLPQGWQAAVAMFKWIEAFSAITRLQHLVESSAAPFLIVRHTLSKHEVQHEATERRNANHSEEMAARRFVPAALVRAARYPFHRARPLLLVVANDVPRRARTAILERLQAALPGLFLSITRKPSLKEKRLGVDDSAPAFDFCSIRDALALGHGVILQGDVGLRDVTQRAFLSCFASVKHGLHPLPMCVLLRGTFRNRSDLFGPKQGSDMEQKADQAEAAREMVDADVKVALERTTRLRLELVEEIIARQTVGSGFDASSSTPAPALVVVMEAVIVLITPDKVYDGPLPSVIAAGAVSWRLSRQLLAQPASFCAKLHQVDVRTIRSVNLVALGRYLCHPLWPSAVVSRSQIDSNRLLYALASWVESAVRTAQLIAADGTGSLAPEITRFRPVPGLFERVIVFNNSSSDTLHDGAGEDSAVMQVMDAVLADVRVYRASHLLATFKSVEASSFRRPKKTHKEETRCIVSLFHECRRIYASVYSPSTGEQWMTGISEDDVDSLLAPPATPLRGLRADKLPPKSHIEMYTRLARLCLLRKRRLEGCSKSIESSSSFELVLRPLAVPLYRHVLHIGGYRTTVTMAELYRGQIRVNAFVHGNKSSKTYGQAVELTLNVELESVLSRLSAAQLRRIDVPTSRIPSMVLDRLHLYCTQRTMTESPQRRVSSLRLSIRTSEDAPGRVLLRRVIRMPRKDSPCSAKLWIFTLIAHHEDGGIQAAFYAPGSSTRHSIRLSTSAAQELLQLSRYATPCQLQRVLLRRFCMAKPVFKVVTQDSKAAIDEEPEKEDTKTIPYYRLRRHIIARFSSVLGVIENVHQRITQKLVVRMYVQVEFDDQELSKRAPSCNNSHRRAICYRMWLPGSCVEQVLVLQESEIETSLPVDMSWHCTDLSERKSISRYIVDRFFQWDPHGSNGETGSIVAHLPCGSFWATKVTSVPGVDATDRHSRQAPTLSDEQTRMLAKSQAQTKTRDLKVAVVSCLCLLDDRDTESDDEEDDSDAGDDRSEGIERKTYSYNTEELVHYGSYRVNGMYVVVRVTMCAKVLREVQSVLVSLSDRVRERDSFTIKLNVYHPASSTSAIAEIHGHRDLREIVGPDKPFLIASTSVASLMRHIILTRLDAQVGRGGAKDSTERNFLSVTFLRDRLYAKQKATPAFEYDSQANAFKLIDKVKGCGIAGERGVKVCTSVKKLSGCGRTLLTVFNVGATNHHSGLIPKSGDTSVMLRVDAYVCSTSARLSLLLEGRDLVHIVDKHEKELLMAPASNDLTSIEEGMAMDKEKSRKLACRVLHYLRVEQRNDGRGVRLVLSDYSCSILDTTDHVTKSKRLFKTIRAVEHDQLVLCAYLDEYMRPNERTAVSTQKLRLELYDPRTSSCCTLKVSDTVLSAIFGLPESKLVQILTLCKSKRVHLMTHLCSFLHIENQLTHSEESVANSTTLSMTLLFDEQQAIECMEQHFGQDTDDGSCRWSWIEATVDTDGNYLSLYLQLVTQNNERSLICSAYSPAKLLVGARRFERTDIPAQVLSLLPEALDVHNTSPFFTKVCQQLQVQISQELTAEFHDGHAKSIQITF